MLCAAVAIATPSAQVEAAPSKHTSKKKATKKKTSKKKATKHKASKHEAKRKRSGRKRAKPPAESASETASTEPSATSTEPSSTAADATANESTPPDATAPPTAATPEAAALETLHDPATPATPEPAPVATESAKPVASVSTSATPVARAGGKKPSWFFGIRGGPSVIDRRGFNEYKSNRQIYNDQRNVRWEIAFGRYAGRHVAFGLALGSGPYPKFDAADPLLDVNTRYEVIPAQARLDLELHASWFVLALGGGGAYEQAKGTFTTQDPDTLETITHTSAFKRFGPAGAARTGLQLQLGPVAFELLAEVSAIKLGRGTYEHSMMSSPGPSDREMCYEGSVLLGLRLQ